jgi:dolichol-phosphate mannosyltransferase
MTYILMAAYNEAENLREIFNQVGRLHWRFPYRIVIVNDGSTDYTHDITESFMSHLPITLVDHEINRGMGEALLTGILFLRNKINAGDDLVILDADNTHPLELIPRMRERIASGFDLVVASRYCPGGNQRGLSFYRRFLSLGASALLKIACPIDGISDYSCGYRMYSADLLGRMVNRFKDALVEEKGFAASIELLLKASLLTDRITQVPLCLRYDKKRGQSKMRVFKTIVRYMMVLINLRRIKGRDLEL